MCSCLCLSSDRSLSTLGPVHTNAFSKTFVESISGFSPKVRIRVRVQVGIGFGVKVMVNGVFFSSC